VIRDRLLRLAQRLVPLSWREAVGADLDHEARGSGRGGLWRAGALAAVGIRMRSATVWTGIASDVFHALRALRRAPWFTAGAILTFALGIGVNVAVFSAVDRMLFRPLPYGDADRLVVMGQYGPGAAQPFGTLSARYVVEARRQVKAFEDLSVSSPPQGYAAEPNGTPILALTEVSANTLDVLRVRPMIGRGFQDDDARLKRGVAVVTYESWRSRLGGADDVVGRVFWRRTEPFEIIGVLPPGFIAPPTLFDPRSDGLVVDFDVLGPPAAGARETPPTVRLAPGVSLETAERELNTLIDRLRRDEPPTGGPPSSFRLAPIRDALFGRYTQYLWVVVAAAALLLLMCCANLASLMLMRGRAREVVTATRIALGATRARLLSAAAVESLLLAAVGSVVALAVVAWTSAGLRTMLPPLFTRYMASATDVRVLIFAIAAASVCALVAGIAPAWRSTRVDVLPALQRAGRGGVARLRGAALLVAVEAAVGVLLVAGAALTARSLVTLMTTDVGFEPRDLHTVNIRFRFVATEDASSRMAPYLEALDVLRRTAGVRAAAGANVLPIVAAAGNRFGPGIASGYRWEVTDGFFETLGIPVVAGRSITHEDLAVHADVAVLSERGLALVWPGVEPSAAVGRSLEFAGEPIRRVVGVVGDVRGSFAQEPEPSIYIPLQSNGFRFMMFAARMAPGAAPPIVELRDRLRHLPLSADPSSAALSRQLSNGLVDQEFRATLFAAFGVTALVLAAIGLYALTSFDVAARSREMGVRLALGATAGRLRWRVVADAVRPAAAGIAAGALIAWWSGRFLQTFLYRVDARDPITLAIVAMVLLTAAALAAGLPARRASRVDPVDVLRAE
jgi:predicted permease